LVVESSKAQSRNLRKERKDCRNSGKEYKTVNGKTVKPTVMKDLKQYRMKCKNAINDPNRSHLFNEYWGMKSYNRRVSYIASLITVVPKKCTKIKTCSPSKQKNRQNSYIYTLIVNKNKKEVCKNCFLTIFGETEGFIRINIQKKLRSVAGITKNDMRGKKEPPNKTSIEQITKVINHIQSFPAYESHYYRRHTSKKYLSSNLTLTLMFELYKNQVEYPVSFSIYSKELKN